MGFDDYYTGSLYSVDGSPTVRGIRLGGTIEGSITDSQSTFTLKATDTDGAVGKNTFIINWHTPYENREKINEFYLPAENIPLTQDKAGSSAQLQYNYEHNRIDFDFGSTLAVGSAFTGGAAAIVALAPGGQGVSAGLSVASAILGGAAAVIGTPPTAQPNPVPQSYITYEDYKAAVTAAGDGEIWPDGQEYYDTPNETGTARITRINLAIGAFSTSPDGDGDDYYQYSTYVTGKAILIPQERVWIGDHYAANGYDGTVPGWSRHPDGVPTIQITWKYDSGSPGSGN